MRGGLAFVFPGQGAQSVLMMREPGDEFPQVRDRFIHNLDVTAHRDAQRIKQALIDRPASLVRWFDTVEFYARVGLATVIERGPDEVLSTLTRRTAESIICFPLSSNDTIQAALDHVGG